MSGIRTSAAEAPLRAFGNALRRARACRRRRRRTAYAAAVMTAALTLTIALPPAPRLVWNASSSAPLGLWLVSPGSPVSPGMVVVARLPKPWRGFAAARRYLPVRVPLVKRVTASTGDEICAIGPEVFRNRKPLTRRLDRDGKGRVMPWWEGCRRLRSGEYFLLMTSNPKSFDGRYFGVTSASQIIGPARLIWAH